MFAAVGISENPERRDFRLSNS